MGKAWIAVGLMLCSCISALDEERSTVGEVQWECKVPVPGGVQDLGPPVSLETPQGSLWIWEDLTLEDGTHLKNGAALVVSADGVCTDGPVLLLGDDSTPMSLLQLSDAEVEANAGREDGRQMVLTPLGGFVDGESAVLYYEHRLNGPGFFDSELLGRGLCRFEEGFTRPCRRLERDGSTILWGPDSFPFNRGGLVQGEFVLLYGCEQVAAFENLCTVARAPLDALENPEAVQYYNPFNGWTQDRSNAGVLLNMVGQGTFRWNGFLGHYTAIGTDIWNSNVVLSLSTEATGDFENTAILFDEVPPSSFFIAGGLEHAALSEDDGRIVRVSYFTNAEGQGHGLHLVSFRFFGGLE